MSPCDDCHRFQSPMNCPNCAAPLLNQESAYVCEYCGTTVKVPAKKFRNTAVLFADGQPIEFIEYEEPDEK